jgi:hypothetical protein
MNGCTIRVEPIGKKQPVVYHRLHHKLFHHDVMADSATVDGDWIRNYRILEGNYHSTVPDDQQIKAVDGKFNVPRSVLTHNADMIHANPTP